MTFKKGEEKTKLAGSKGGLKTQEVHSEVQSNLTLGRKGDTYRKFNTNKEHQINAGKMSRHWENLKAEEMKKRYDEVFQPFVVCDRLCVKDEKIIFVEIKKSGQILSEQQKIFQELCNKLGYSYVVEYI